MIDVKKTAINASRIPIDFIEVNLSSTSIVIEKSIGIITDIFAATVVVVTPDRWTLKPINLNMVIKITPRISDNIIQSEWTTSLEKGKLLLKKKPAEQAVM